MDIIAGMRKLRQQVYLRCQKQQITDLQSRSATIALTTVYINLPAPSHICWGPVPNNREASEQTYAVWVQKQPTRRKGILN